jgi:hypothetical protein
MPKVSKLIAGPSAVKVSGEIGSGSITEMAVPGPMAWLLMLAGFGGVGAALRRRTARPVSISAAGTLSAKTCLARRQAPGTRTLQSLAISKPRRNAGAAPWGTGGGPSVGPRRWLRPTPDS